MADPYSTKEFKKLRDEWYQKLEAPDSGFIDIETPDGEFKDHKTMADLTQRIHFKDGVRELTESHYSWACDMAYHGVFKSDRDKRIWELHSEGLTGSEISTEVKLQRTWVNRKIQRIHAYLKAQESQIKSVLPYIQTDIAS